MMPEMDMKSAKKSNFKPKVLVLREL